MTTTLRYYLATLLAAVFGFASTAAGSIDHGAGNYGGLIEPPPGQTPVNSGLIQLQLTNSGQMTGVLIWQGQRYPFKGELTEAKPFVGVFKKKLSTSPIELGIVMSLSVPSRFITGELTENLGGSVVLAVPISLNGAVPDPVLMEKLQPGLRISFIDPPDPTTEGEAVAAADFEPELGPIAAEIPGDGFVHVRIARKKRASRLVGKLPDAQGAFTAGSPLRGSNYTLYSSLYKKKRQPGGQVFGLANVFDPGSGLPDYTSSLRWGKAPGLDPNYYPGPIDLLVALDALPYPKLRRGSLVPLLPQQPSPIAPYGIVTEPIHSIDARILFRRGNISLPDGAGGTQRYFKENLKINPFRTRVVGANPHQVKIRMDAFSGRFHGTFMHPVLMEKTRFRGAFQAAVLFNPGQGRGHFRPPTSGIIPLLEPLESGGVRINVN
jgi:hypothetical protein